MFSQAKHLHNCSEVLCMGSTVQLKEHPPPPQRKKIKWKQTENLCVISSPKLPLHLIILCNKPPNVHWCAYAFVGLLHTIIILFNAQIWKIRGHYTFWPFGMYCEALAILQLLQSQTYKPIVSSFSMWPRSKNLMLQIVSQICV